MVSVMFGWTAGLLLACVMLYGCVQAEPRLGGPPEGPDASDGRDVASEVRADGASGDSELGAEVETCKSDGDCAWMAEACFVGACVDGVCARAVRVGLTCDDGEVCTGDGRCDAEGRCLSVDDVPDGTRCDEDGLACNGTAECRSGACVEKAAVACPASDNPCISEVRCDEVSGGTCIEVLADDGSPCEVTGVPESHCSRGACVPRGMVYIGAGAFTMGCLAGDCSADNQPSHAVTLSAYAIDRTEVTEAEYRACQDDPRPERACEARDGVVADIDGGGERPAAFLDWSRAKAVCEYQGKRLCTEAEWERAARGVAAGRRYPWGEADPSCELANFWAGSGSAGCDSGGSFAVGSLPDGASADGVLDMAGNVAEWVFDAYRVDAYSREGRATRDPVETVDPMGGGRRVLRGGGWASSAIWLKTYARASRSTDEAGAVGEQGVRCCLSVERP